MNGERVLDPQTFPVSADGATQAQLPTRSVPSRRPVQRSDYVRTDTHSEVQVLMEKVASLEAAAAITRARRDQEPQYVTRAEYDQLITGLTHLTKLVEGLTQPGKDSNPHE